MNVPQAHVTPMLGAMIPMAVIRVCVMMATQGMAILVIKVRLVLRLHRWPKSLDVLDCRHSLFV